MIALSSFISISLVSENQVSYCKSLILGFILSKYQKHRNRYAGLTISGGDPLLQRDELKELLDILKSTEPDMNIWVYTGYTLEELIKKYSLKYLKSHIDVLVDGEYKEELKDFYYHWAGSTNQRVIKLKEVADE